VNFVQIGTNDGLRWDPVRRFIIRDDWNGVLVEPLPPVFELLKKNYAHVTNRKLVFANVAVSSDDSESFKFWSFSKSFCDSLSIEDRLYYLRKSSTDRRLVEANLKGFDDIQTMIECYTVPALSVNTLLDKYWDGDPIDLIFIDAEGHDDRIIRAIDFARIQPAAILYESHNLRERKQGIQEYLQSRGYTVTDLVGDSVASR
jgi:FkbM family methyltransferase